MKIAKVLALIIIGLGFGGLYILKDSEPLVRLVVSSLGMIEIIKIAALIWQISDGAKFQSRLGMVLFFFAWPGVSVSGFTERGEVAATTGARFFESWLTFLAGIGILIGVSLIGRGEVSALNYVALFSVLLILHLGLIEVIADGIRLLGFSPSSLFDRPFLAASLRDFWSLRWNRAFVDMNKIFILGPLREKVPLAILTFSIFAVSGILHEIGISYADGVSWGFPLLYFLIQGIGMEIERHRKLPRILVWALILLPMPLLFTPAFTNLFMGSLSGGISDFAANMNVSEFYKYGLFIGGISHLLVLCASIQVPEKLGWREEFKNLSSLNRKVFWTYGGYIFAIIVFMSVTSFSLGRQDFQSLSFPSFLWVLFIALFWWARVLADFFYMNHSDWPQGPLFSVGHVCLSTLFFSLSALYTILAYITYGAIK
ncbi:MAG: hypothetical protein J0L82_15370 [Deltaproteobacteria bacterium]|nr:hypothetical protein [Deltaproteobacteria bacterium]